MEKIHYLCECYPDYNLFTLRKLIPIDGNGTYCEVSAISVFCPLLVPFLFYSSLVKGLCISARIGKVFLIGRCEIVSTTKVFLCTHIKIIVVYHI